MTEPESPSVAHSADGSPQPASSSTSEQHELPGATVILFKPSGKYYTEERWEIPADAVGPSDMTRSKDFRRISGGPVLVETQDPWGYPHLL